MTWPVRVTSAAEEEFAEAAVWYYRRSPKAANDFASAVQAAFQAIGDNPALFPVVHLDIRRARVRSFPHSVYFVKTESECVVVAVHHGRMSPRRWRRRGAR